MSVVVHNPTQPTILNRNRSAVCVSRVVTRTFAACFLAVVMLTGWQSQLLASCGDYLDHGGRGGMGLDRLPSPVAPAQDSDAPICKSGRCNQAPLAPLETTRASNPRIQNLCWSNGNDDDQSQFSGKCNLANDCLPDSPFIDVAVPPPRYLVS